MKGNVEDAMVLASSRNTRQEAEKFHEEQRTNYNINNQLDAKTTVY